MLIIEITLLIYFSYITSYSLFFAVCSNIDKKVLRKDPSSNSKDTRANFCVLIPAYKEDAVILKSAKQALNQTYPSKAFDVVVIGDSLNDTTLQELEKLPVITIPVSFKQSTKVKSLNFAMDYLENEYDYCVILDADNVMEDNFLELADELFKNRNLKAIQGQRKPKNQHNTLSFLDGVSESINTSIFRRGTSVAGLSSSISGSGFAVEYGLLKNLLASMDAVGGFDKELEILLILKGVKVKYIHELIVFDEKVSSTHNFENQRKRWISSQYHYLSKYFSKGISALFSGYFTLFNSTVLRNLQLPRLINIGLFTVLAVTALILKDQLIIPYYTWLILYSLNAFAIFISIPKEFYSVRLIYSIAKLPLLFIKMISALFQIKKANKKFIHTPHEI